MAEKTGIAWCDSTFNPWIGCTKVGPGCDHCYAEAMDSRKRWGGVTHWGPGTPRMRTSPANWRQPLTWNRKAAESGKPWRVFCASLADVFDNEAPDEWRMDLFRLIEQTPNLTWLLLTKRIGNAAKMIADARASIGDGRGAWPWPNVWLGATIVNQEEADRDIPKLLATPAAVRFVSYEPALGPVDFTPWLRIAWQCSGCRGYFPQPWRKLCPNCGREDYWSGSHAFNPPGRQIGSGLDWIIVGGESGPHARPFDMAWARSTIAQCKAAGVACFVKQLGHRPYLPCHRCDGKGYHHGFGEHGHDPDWCSKCGGPGHEWPEFKDRAGADPSEWPEDLRVQEHPRERVHE